MPTVTPESVKAAADCTTQRCKNSALFVGSITRGGKQKHPAKDEAPLLLTVCPGHGEGATDCPTQ